MLYKVLKYSPSRRITPLQALQHPFFDELREEQVYSKLRKEYQIMDLFDFRGTKEVASGSVGGLVPKWYGQ